MPQIAAADRMHLARPAPHSEHTSLVNDFTRRFHTDGHYFQQRLYDMIFGMPLGPWTRELADSIVRSCPESIDVEVHRCSSRDGWNYFWEQVQRRRLLVTIRASFTPDTITAIRSVAEHITIEHLRWEPVFDISKHHEMLNLRATDIEISFDHGASTFNETQAAIISESVHPAVTNLRFDARALSIDALRVLFTHLVLPSTVQRVILRCRKFTPPLRSVLQAWVDASPQIDCVEVTSDSISAFSLFRRT
jgi:hypothetical protein